MIELIWPVLFVGNHWLVLDVPLAWLAVSIMSIGVVSYGLSILGRHRVR